MTEKFHIDNLHSLFPNVSYIYYEPIHNSMISITDYMNIEFVKTELEKKIYRLCEVDVEIENKQLLCYVLWWMRTYSVNWIEFRQECLKRQEEKDKYRVLEKLVDILRR